MYSTDPDVNIFISAAIVSTGMVLLLLMISFLFSLHRILLGISIKNRAIEPHQVFLLLIPVFNFYWQFVVISRVSISLYNEFKDRGIANGTEPCFKEGLTANMVSFVLLIPELFPFSVFIFAITYIYYWIQLLKEAKKIEPPKNHQLSFHFDRY